MNTREQPALPPCGVHSPHRGLLLRRWSTIRYYGRVLPVAAGLKAAVHQDGPGVPGRGHRALGPGPQAGQRVLAEATDILPGLEGLHWVV